MYIGTIASVLPAVEGRLGEGDCALVRGDGRGFRLMGMVPWRAWAREAARSGVP